MAMKGKGKQLAGKAPASSPSSSGKRKKPVSEAKDAGARRKKKRSGVLQFFDDAAVDADYDEEEDEDLDMEDEDLDFDFSNEAKVESKDVKGAGKSHQLPFFLKEEELSGDELEELIKDRYGRGSEFVVYDEDDKECDDSVSAVHSMTDPTIWRVKCMLGREQQIAFCFMQKYVDLQKFGTKMEIISAFALEHVKGYVYIEADKACDVTEACKGFCNVYSTRMGLVPRNEIPHLLSVRNKACEVSKGTWVRMKNGKYKGDLGQVVAVDDARKRATIKMVPRIDLQAIAKKFGGGISLKQAAVPSPRLISSHELEHFRPHIEIRRDRESGEVFEVLDGLMLKDGYLFKKVSIASLDYWGVQPSKDELLKFMDTSMYEDDDVNWLSSVYDGRKKMKSSRTSDHKGAAKEGNGFDLHDLVFFGKKAFGVIIAMGKDGFQILKGDTEGQEVVTVNTQEIKNCCVDKMFTASDHHKKTISINDIVKVLEGPLVGRQGIVRHMYKGTLFIYDENQPENCGFFCAKSDLCENIKQSKDSSFEKSGNKSSPSFAQSPIRSCEQEDSSCTFGTRRRSETNQTFSIGQTLRIRKGPLKGYLCRVVGVYRSDVTVKLDSLVKVITVEEQFLSVPNLKRDDSAAVPSDIFGTQERPPIGSLADEGRDQPMGLSSWDGGRDSWQALSTSSFSVSINNDQKADQGSDPWGSKMALAARDKEREADPWGSKVSLSARDEEQGADPWGSKLASGARDQERGADPWGSKVALTSRDKEQGTDPWGSKVPFGDSCLSDKAMDSWAKASGTSGEQNSSWNKAAGGEKAIGLGTQAGNCEKDADGWCKPSVKSITGTDGWDKGKLPSVDAGESWGGKCKDADGWDKSSVKSNTGTDGWDKEKLPSVDAGESWGRKGFLSRSQADTSDSVLGRWDAPKSDVWDKGQRPSVDDSESWGRNSFKSGNQVDSSDSVLGRWNGPKADFHHDALKSTGASNVWAKTEASNDAGKGDKWEQSSNWTRPEVSGDDKADAWDIKGKGVARSEEVAWGKATESQEKDANESRQWGKTSDSSSQKTSVNITSLGGEQAVGWDAAAMSLTKSAVEHGGQAGSWGKVKDPSDGQSGWDEGGWSKTGFSTQNQKDGWNKSKSFSGDKVSSWNKVDNEEAGKNDQRNSWDKPRNFEGGSGFGRGRGRGRNAWGSGNGDQEGKWNKPMDRDGGRGFGWGRGGDGTDGAGSSRDQENSWNRQRDFDGGRGSSWGRGRGRYGGRGSRDEDSQNSSGGWGSGRGRGRGRSGDAGSFIDNFDDKSSSGRGRGRGRGRFQSSDWNNNQENFGDESFSRNPVSSWGNDQNSGWDKSEGFSKNEESSGKMDQLGGWAGSKTASQDAGGSSKQSSDWKKDEGSNKWNTPKAFSDNQPSCWNQATSGNDAVGGSNWNTPKASASSNQFSGWENRSTRNEDDGKAAGGVRGGWDSAKQSEGKKSSSWTDNKTAGNEEAAGAGGNWDRAKPSGAKQSDWNNGGRKEWSTLKSQSEVSFSDWIPGSAGNETGDAAAGGNNWNKAKPSSGGHAAEPSNWNNSKAWGDKSSSDWNQNSNASEAGKEAGSSGGDWGKPRRFSGGSQLSGWNNDEGSNWNKPKFPGGDQSSSWTDRSAGFQEGGGGNQSEGWNRGRNFGRDQPYGGRGNSFSNRGRGRGRNFGGGRSMGWNGGEGANKEGNGSGDQSENFSRPRTFGRGQLSTWNQEGFTSGGSWSKGKESCGNQSGWIAGETADKGSGESWKTEAAKQPSGWTKQDSGWNKCSSAANEGGSSSGGGNGDRPKGSDNSGGPGWNTGKAEGWNEKKVSDGAKGGSSNWNSHAVGKKDDGGSKGQQEGAWGPGSYSKGGQASNWNQKDYTTEGCADGSSSWNSSAVPVKEVGGSSHKEDKASNWNQKDSTAEGCADGSSSWNSSVVTVKEGGGSSHKEDKASSWNQKGSDGAAGSSGWNDKKVSDGAKGGSSNWNSHAVRKKEDCWDKRQQEGVLGPGSSSKRGQASNWNQKDSTTEGCADGSSGWNSSAVPLKEVGGASGPKEDAWGGGSSHKEEKASAWNQKGSDSAAGSCGWNSGGGSAQKDDGWGGGTTQSMERASGLNQGAAVKEADAWGDRGSSWEKASGSWGNTKDGSGGKGGW